MHVAYSEPVLEIDEYAELELFVVPLSNLCIRARLL
jgi:hypothetical protein